jgi:hypothetical protein
VVRNLQTGRGQGIKKGVVTTAQDGALDVVS